MVRGDGWIERRGGSLRVRWRDGEVTRSKRVSDEDEAERVLLEVRQQKRSGRYVAPSVLTVGTLVREYLERGAGRWKSNTLRLYRGTYARYIDRQLGEVRAEALTTLKVQQWVDGLERDGKAAVTIETAVIVLGGAVREAIRLGRPLHDVVRGVRIPKRVSRTQDAWTTAEVEAIYRVVADDPWWNAWYRVGLGTGMRPGELRALMWRDIDLVRGRITVRRTVTRTVEGREYLGASTKTGAERVIAITPSIGEALKRMRIDQATRRLAAGTWVDRDLVFAAGDGDLSERTGLLDHHHAWLEVAGVRKLHPHYMRHTYATVALEAGVPLVVVSRALGHTKTAITADTYTHVVDSVQEEAAMRVDTAYRATTRG